MKKTRHPGPAKWVAPFLVVILAMLLGTTLMFPMLKMEPRNIPIAVLSLDKGAKVQGEKINLGDELIEALTETDEDDADAESGAEADANAELESEDDAKAEPEAESSASAEPESESDVEEDEGLSSDMVDWHVVSTQEELDALMDEGICYASLVVPENFTATQAAARGKDALGSGLVEGLPDLAKGASALSSGSGTLASGASSLASGLGQVSSGAAALQQGVSQLPDQTQALANGAASLSSGITSVKDASETLATGLQSASQGADATNQAIATALALMEQGQTDKAQQVLAQAAQASQATSTGIAALAENAPALTSGLTQLETGASSLSQGTAALAQGAQTLADGVSALSGGLEKTSQGASALSSGAGTLSGGLGTFSGKFNDANDTLSELDDLTKGEEDPDTPAALQLTINQGKNPMISSSLTMAMQTMASSSGVAIETSYINELPDNMSMGFTHMILMLLTYISSYAAGIVISQLLKPSRTSRGSLLKGLLAQTLYSAVLSLFVGLGVAGILSVSLGGQIPFTDLALFVALASFALQLLVIGSVDLMGMAGMIVPIGLLIVGMGTAYLPTEFLPDLWQMYVYPWDPLRFMADGYRGILYMGRGFDNAAAGQMLLVVAVGLALMVLNCFKKVQPDPETKPIGDALTEQ